MDTATRMATNVVIDAYIGRDRAGAAATRTAS